MTSRFSIGDRVRLSALGRRELDRDWPGIVIETDCSKCGDIIRVRRDNGRKTSLTWAGYWELTSPEPVVGFEKSSSVSV